MSSSEARKIFTEITSVLCIEMYRVRSWTRERDASSWNKAIKERNRDEDKDCMDWEGTVHSENCITRGKECKCACACRGTKQVSDSDRHRICKQLM
jgi:hypothetical protein